MMIMASEYLVIKMIISVPGDQDDDDDFINSDDDNDGDDYFNGLSPSSKL